MRAARRDELEGGLSDSLDVPPVARRRSASARLDFIGMPGCWAAIGAMVLADAVLCHVFALTVTAMLAPVVTVTVLMAAAIPYRATRRSVAFADCLEGVAIYVAFTVAAVVLIYATARNSRPFADAYFAAGDAMLGFHWPAWYAMAEGQPTLHAILHAAYDSLLVQPFLIMPLLAFIGRRARIIEFVWVAFLSLAVTVAVAAFFPAQSPPVWFGIRPEMLYFKHIMILRGADPVQYRLTELTGLVSFPSFHAVTAVALVLALRGIPYIGWVALALNAVMVVSVLNEGGHYLVDALAGVFVAGVAWVAVRMAMRRAR